MSSSKRSEVDMLLEGFVLLNEEVKKSLKNQCDNGFGNDGCLKLDGQKGEKKEEINDEVLGELCQYIKLFEENIKGIEIQNNQITSKGAIILVDFLKENKIFLKKLNLFGNPLDNGCLKPLGEYIAINKNIEEINFGHDAEKQRGLITDQGVAILSEYVIGNKTLKLLSLSGNKNIKQKSVEMLNKMVESSNIEYLEIKGTSINKPNIIFVSLAQNRLKSGNKALKFIDLAITDADLIKICGFIDKDACSNLESINFENNRITSKGAITLFKTLKNCDAKISKLSLFDNQLSDSCMEALGEFIQSNKSLEEVNIGSNKSRGNRNISDTGIKKLLPFIIGNTTLKVLEIENNKDITEKSVEYFTKMADESHIEIIELKGSSISDLSPILYLLELNKMKIKSEIDKLISSYPCVKDENIVKFREVIKRYQCKILKQICIEKSKVTSKGAIILFDTLKEVNCKVTRVDLNHNQLDDGCMKSLGEFIQSNENMQEISINNNKITDQGVEILSSHLEGNTSLKVIDISYNQGITDKSISCLVKMIETTRIIKLYIRKTSITQENLVLVPLVNNILKYGYDTIDLSYKSLKGDDIIAICEGIKKYGCDKVKKINLDDNKLTSKEAAVLFDTLKETNSKIIHLHLYGNQLDDECMQSLGEFVDSNGYLETLDIGYTNITDKGIEILSEFLIGNTTLKKLNICDCYKILDGSFPCFEKISKYSCITDIHFFSEQLSLRVRTELTRLFATPIERREIPIKSNTKSAAKTF